MARFNPNEIRRKMREAQRKAEREINKINRANKKAVDDYNRKVKSHNQTVINKHNAQVRENNRKANAHNKKVIVDLNKQLRSASGGVRYTEREQVLADRVHEAVPPVDSREYDVFISYARIDGGDTAGSLRDSLEELGVAVWFDEVAIVPGRSQSLQMDTGLRKARAGVAVLTPAYLTGRFWTERELGVLLGKSVLIPVLHNTTFEDVSEYSGILPDLAGFTTDLDSVQAIAQKIAAAIMPTETDEN